MPVRRLRALLPAVLALALAGPPGAGWAAQDEPYVPSIATGNLGHSAGRPAVPGPSACPRRVTHAAVPAGQPVFPCEFPDPTIFRDPATHAWYAYATAVGWNHERHLFPILKSKDLKGWRAVGDGLRSWPRWAYTDLWAPTVVRAHGTYYLFYTGKRRRDEVHCIGVATAPAAVGPFHDRGPVTCRDALTKGYIDPAVLQTRRRTYLYFSVDKPHHALAVQPLRDDLLRPAGPRRTLLRFGDPWQRGLAFGTVEAPSVIQRGGRVLLFYSSGCWCFDYRMGLATAVAPTGPFTDDPGNPILVGTAGLIAPGGGSLFPGPGGRIEMAFHAWSAGPSSRQGGRRTLRIAPMRFSGGGAAPVLAP